MGFYLFRSYIPTFLQVSRLRPLPTQMEFATPSPYPLGRYKINSTRSFIGISLNTRKLVTSPSNRELYMKEHLAGDSILFTNLLRLRAASHTIRELLSVHLPPYSRLQSENDCRFSSLLSQLAPLASSHAVYVAKVRKYFQRTKLNNKFASINFIIHFLQIRTVKGI